jgi:hypothetical protein
VLAAVIERISGMSERSPEHPVTKPGMRRAN